MKQLLGYSESEVIDQDACSRLVEIGLRSKLIFSGEKCNLFGYVHYSLENRRTRRDTVSVKRK